MFALSLLFKLDMLVVSIFLNEHLRYFKQNERFALESSSLIVLIHRKVKIMAMQNICYKITKILITLAFYVLFKIHSL